MADGSFDVVFDFDVWGVDAGQHVVLHLLKSYVQRVTRLEISEHDDSILLSIMWLSPSQKNRIVACYHIGFFGSDLVFKPTEHDFLLIFELFFLALRVPTRGRDCPFEREPDVCNQFLALRIVYSYLDHCLCVLTCTWSDKLSLYLSLTFTEKPECSGHSALSFDGHWC